MNKLFKVIFGIVFTFLFAFTGIGYAQLTDNMNLNGAITFLELKTIYIVTARVVETSDGSTVNALTHSGANLTSDITLSPSDPNAYITIEIVVKNNSGFEAGFNDIIYSLGAAYNNENIVFTSDPYSVNTPYGIHHMDKKLGGDELRTFRVNIEYKNNTVATNNELKSTVKFEFIPWAISGALAVFENLLNNEFDRLDQGLGTENYYTNSFVSNVNGASNADKQFINTAFEGNMSTFIPNKDGELVETQMKIFIKRANLDGNFTTGDENGDEYILFMTADPLTTRNGTAIVYAYAFTRFSQNEEYIMIGEMFEGKATITNYQGREGTGSFITDKWYSAKEYYGVAAGTGRENNEEKCGNLGDIVAAAIAAGAYEGAPTN